MNLENFLVGKINGCNKTVVKSTVRKTFQRKQFEPEVIELTAEQEYDRAFTPLELSLVTELNKAGIEYSLYVQLYALGEVTVGEFADRKKIMLTTVESLIAKLEKTEPSSEVLKEVKANLSELTAELEQM